jgi:hypothetical protein
MMALKLRAMRCSTHRYRRSYWLVGMAGTHLSGARLLRKALLSRRSHRGLQSNCSKFSVPGTCQRQAGVKHSSLSVVRSIHLMLRTLNNRLSQQVGSGSCPVYAHCAALPPCTAADALLLQLLGEQSRQAGLRHSSIAPDSGRA